HPGEGDRLRRRGPGRGQRRRRLRGHRTHAGDVQEQQEAVRRRRWQVSAHGAARDRSGARRLFQAASYLQYPFMLLALFYVMRPYFTGFASIFADFNLALLHAGVGIGFSSLQDPTTTQNEVSRKVWEDPRKGNLAIGIIVGAVALALGGGLAGLYLGG